MCVCVCVSGNSFDCDHLFQEMSLATRWNRLTRSGSEASPGHCGAKNSFFRTWTAIDRGRFGEILFLKRSEDTLNATLEEAGT